MKDLIKVKIEKVSKDSYWYNQMVGDTVLVEKYNHDNFKLYGSSGLFILKDDCTVLQDDTQPERTPENAQVLNKWANENHSKRRHIYKANYGYMHSANIEDDNSDENYFCNSIHDGFTESFTVEEFFAKVKLQELRKIKVNPDPEPVLIAKAGDKIKFVSHNDTPDLEIFFTINKEYETIYDFYEGGRMDILEDNQGYNHGLSEGFILEKSIKFEKVSPPVVEPTKETIHFSSRTDGLFRYMLSIHQLIFSTDELNDIIDIVYETANPKQPIEQRKEDNRISFDIELWKSGKYDIVTSKNYPFRLLCTDRNYEDLPIFGFATIEGEEVGCGYTWCGKGRKDHDLFLTPKKVSVWVNRFESKGYLSKEDALRQNSALSLNLKYIETIEVIKEA